MRDAALARGACIVVDNPYVVFRTGQRSFGSSGTCLRVARGVQPSAVVDPSAQIHPTATVGPLCVVERGAVVGEGSVLTLRVTLGENCQVGARCLLHPGWSSAQTVLALLPHQGAWVKIEQLGAVRIGDDVEIGANTCIDRGASAGHGD